MFGMVFPSSQAWPTLFTSTAGCGHGALRLSP
jgi:hypothetical protein